MFKLQNRIELIVPKEDNQGNEISDKHIKSCVNNITMEAGGCTITEVTGQWYSEDENRIMQDNNLNLEWYYTNEYDTLNFMAHAIKSIVNRLINVYDQEAISIKINSTLYIVDQSDIEELHTTLKNIM